MRRRSSRARFSGGPAATDSPATGTSVHSSSTSALSPIEPSALKRSGTVRLSSRCHQQSRSSRPPRPLQITDRIKAQFSTAPLPGSEGSAPAVPPKETVFEAAAGVFSPDPARMDQKRSPLSDGDKTPTSSSSTPPSIAKPVIPPISTDSLPRTTSGSLTTPNGSPTFLLAGLSLSHAAAASLLAKAKTTLPSQSVRLPLLGEYTGCFTGPALVTFLAKEVEGFGGDEDKATEAAKELVETLGLIRRVSAVSRGTWSNEAGWFFQFTDKARLLASFLPCTC